ncbi:MAG TPA: preprotein translocase subunit SecG [Fibrobacteraceae bacterium]|nr:preprotein translocase subunit SecG [Fibrobacteraceae bacterium]
MPVLFWILIAVHIFLCVFLVFLVLLQNDKMGGLAGLTGVASQTFSGTGAATFVQKLTRWVAFSLMAVVLALGYFAMQHENQIQGTELKRTSSGLGAVLPQGITDLQGAPGQQQPQK